MGAAIHHIEDPSHFMTFHNISQHFTYIECVIRGIFSRDVCPVQSSGVEQWLQRHPEAGSSWPSPSRSSYYSGGRGGRVGLQGAALLPRVEP